MDVFKGRPVLSHVDVRVRNRPAAVAFYGTLLAALGHAPRSTDDWTTYTPQAPDEATGDWFGFTEDPNMTPGATRIALAAASCEDVDRVTTVLLELGAKHIEGPGYDYGPEYYAVFFEDPDGNKLEVCCIGPQALAAS